MLDRHLKKRILKWCAEIGRQEAETRLINAGLSLSLTQKLLAGTYPDQPKIDKIQMIEKAMGAA